jgi:hypothetical protein
VPGETSKFFINPSKYFVKIIRILEFGSDDSNCAIGNRLGFLSNNTPEIVDLPDDDSAILLYRLR